MLRTVDQLLLYYLNLKKKKLTEVEILIYDKNL
jgi:hypothetical protein